MRYRFASFDPETQSFDVRQSEIPKLAPGEILVRVSLCTICGSDLHSYSGRRKTPSGSVLGHEIVGEIVEWQGESPRDFHSNEVQKGQRVTWTMAVGCGDCFFCDHRLNQKCESVIKYGHGAESLRGGLAEYVILTPETTLFSIPDSMSDEVACPANCATATVCASTRLAVETHEISHSSVMISGGGMLGMSSLALAKSLDADKIFLIEPDIKRREIAERFGASVSCNPMETDVVQWIKDHTDGRGADIAFDYAGVLPAVETCIQSVRTGGCVVLAGSVFPMSDLSISPESIVRRMLTIRGLHNYLPDDLANAIEFLKEHGDHFPFADLVEKTFHIDDVEQAFDHAAKTRPIRVAINPRR